MKVIRSNKLFTAALLTLAFLSALCFYNAAKADAYLHVQNASDYCYAYNFYSADSIMVLSVGVHIIRQQVIQPWGYTRIADNRVVVENIYSTYLGIFAVRYACDMYGSDSNMRSLAIGQTTAVYYNGG